jgi:translation initiation factor eIF-2B subunit alpha
LLSYLLIDSHKLRHIQSFPDLKKELVRQGKEYASEAFNFRAKIAEQTLGFIKDDSVVRCLLSLPSHRSLFISHITDINALLLTRRHASTSTRTQAQENIGVCHRSTASWLGVRTPMFSHATLSGSCNVHSIKTYEQLTAAGIPCTVVLDSAVAYVMDKVDFVLVGSEAIVESGGLINAVGSNQMAVLAKAENRPFYALTERCGI